MKNEEINKVPIGVMIAPESFSLFKAASKKLGVNLSQMLTMVIHRRNEEGFKYYDVDPPYGGRAESTKKTLLYLSEEHAALLQRWADKENRSLTSIVRSLMDTAITRIQAAEKAKVENPDKHEIDTKTRIFEELKRYNVDLIEFFDEQLSNFISGKNTKYWLENANPDIPCIFDRLVELTDKQLTKLQSNANRNKIELQSAKLAFELFVLVALITDHQKFCHVSKRQFNDLKQISQNIGTTPSKLINHNLQLLQDPKYHSPTLPEDEELLRVNLKLEYRTILILEQYSKDNRMKFAESVRTLTSFIHNFYAIEGERPPLTYVF